MTAGGVGQRVDAAETSTQAFGDQPWRRGRVGELGRNEGGRDAAIGQLLCHRVAARLVAAGQQQARGAGTRQGLRNRTADALRRAGNQRHLAVNPRLHAASPGIMFLFFRIWNESSRQVNRVRRG